MKLPNYQDLSKEQDRAVNLPLDGSFLVYGPPGSGKTVVALYRAQMLSGQRRKAHLLMRSRLLSQYTTRASRHLGVESTVATYDSWLWRFFRSTYHQEVPSFAPWEYDWPEVMNVVNTRPSPGTRVTDLVIDEGQDLPKEFYMVARMVSRNLTVFADENQRLMEANSSLEQIRHYGGFNGDQAHKLRRNFRNTREIAQLAAHFYTGLPSGIPELPERSGDWPVLLRHDSLRETVEMIVNFERANSDLQIGVFTPTRKLQSRLIRELDGSTVNAVQAYARVGGAKPPELDFSKPGIYVLNYPSTKGLEFDAVFMPALDTVWLGDDETSQRMQMYVMTSRARDRLFLCYSGERVPPVLFGLPDELVELRT